MNQTLLRELAQKGAALRIEELRREIIALEPFVNGAGLPIPVSPPPSAPPVMPRKRTMSAKARKAIGAAQRARWAALKAAKTAQTKKPRAQG
jgi:hypothetical protein